MNDIRPLSEKVPVEETLLAIKYIETERDKELVSQYIEQSMPLGDSTSKKFRMRFFERFVELKGNQITYTPLLRFINDISNYQTKKEIIYYIACVKHGIIGNMVKALSDKKLGEETESKDFKEYMKKILPEAQEGTIKKTGGTVLGILKDFNILIPKLDGVKKSKVFKVNRELRPTNETILFCLYYEFSNIKENKTPSGDVLMSSDVFKYFLLSEVAVKRYLKWMIDNGFIEYSAMGGNTQYQFRLNSLDELVEKVI